MKRIVIFGQPGAFGHAACVYVADRLGQRLGLPRFSAGAQSAQDLLGGWIAVEPVGTFTPALFRAADTAVWLHYSTLAVAREWARHLRAQFCGSARCGRAPRLVDLGDSLQHMAWTPHVHRRLQDPSLSHLHIHHLRSPAETDFWLHAQDHRWPPTQAAVQPA
jgi:hypothetical protein